MFIAHSQIPSTPPPSLQPPLSRMPSTYLSSLLPCSPPRIYFSSTLEDIRQFEFEILEPTSRLLITTSTLAGIEQTSRSLLDTR